MPHVRHAATAAIRPSANLGPGSHRIGDGTLHKALLASQLVIPRRRFETLICRLLRDSVQFCSGLVDLVVGVGHHLGGGHHFALAGERFVGLVAEDVAQVGDRGAELGDPRRRQRTKREPGDSGRRFIASAGRIKAGRGACWVNVSG
jgi:hypothetical protein